MRVRLLVDDLYTEDIGPLLEGLGAYPNVEVRIFNPFPTRGDRKTLFLGSLNMDPRSDALNTDRPGRPR